MKIVNLFALCATFSLSLCAFGQTAKEDIAERFKWVKPSAIQSAINNMSQSPSYDRAKFEKLFNEIEQNYQYAQNALSNGDTKPAERILELQRAILLSNPLLDIDKIVTLKFNLNDRDRKAMCGELGAPPANYSSLYSSTRTGQEAQIVELSNLRQNIGQRTIFKPSRKVNIGDDIQLHWNGDRMIFSSIDANNKWQIYEVNVDGSGFKQKVKLDEADVEFCDATYLPDGRVIASSTIGYNGVPCVNGEDAVGNFGIYDPKNGSFRRLTFDQDGNWNPVVTQSGRIMYTRWEYTDLTHYFSRIIMHMNPDGTENKALYGSGGYWPNSTFDIHPLPGSSSQFIGIVSGHHGVPHSGRLVIFDPAKGRKEEKGVVQELPYKGRAIVPEIKDYLVQNVWPQFAKPYPLDDKYFLVAAKLSKNSLWGIYLIDVYDNLTLIYEESGAGITTPIALRKSVTPPVIPDRVNLSDRQATVFIQDVYQGEGTQGVPRGTIKHLRVFAYEYAYLSSPSDHDAQGVQSGWDIKRLLGTVPVESDGSVLFKVPADVPISLQPLDENGAAIQWFRSWFTAKPGETVSCIGCHEDQNQIVMPKRVMASQIKPHAIKIPEGGVRPFTFRLEMQPILDRACVSCHNGTKTMPDLRGSIADTMRRGVVTKRVTPWDKSYLALHPYVYRQGPEADMYVLKPYEYHASNSELVRILKNNHHNVSLTDKEWRTIYNWIDFNAPFSGSFDEIWPIKDCKDQYSRRIELMKKYNDIKVDWRKEIRDYAQYLKNQGEITPVLPEKAKSTKFSKLGAKAPEIGEFQNEREFEISINGQKIKFVWVPSGEFTMGGVNGDHTSLPLFRAKVNNGFWMSQCEISNEQYQTIFPDHDSRFIGQQWKDHTTPGYAINEPRQPAVRVSWQQATEFCEKLSKKLGVNIKLPSETQWEWACRAGSNSDFWFGNLNSDYGNYDNMSDKQTSKFAVIGVDPKPMKATEPLRKFWDYTLRDANVDDGALVTAAVGSYKANPWGLKDMHGNAAEWTSSDYLPYPLKNDATNRSSVASSTSASTSVAGSARSAHSATAIDMVSGSVKKVARGGAWSDRAKNNTSYSRRAFLPWQRPYNVGFRIIIEQ